MTPRQPRPAGSARASEVDARVIWMDDAADVTAVSRRPRDRRAQIASVAARLFASHGYDSVTVAGIGGAVGVSPGAVYRHFPDKLTLLSEPVREMVTAWYASALIAVDSGQDPLDRLHRLTTAVVHVALDRPDVVGLWHRESRHLPGELRAELVRLRARTIDMWERELCEQRPDLGTEEGEFRIRAALGLLNCVPQLTHQVARSRLSEHLERLVLAVLLAPAAYDTERCSGGFCSPGPTDVPASRRDVLLHAGAALFRERGYHRVGMDDIGQAAGIRGPSVYSHFRSKEDVLFELLKQMADRLDIELDAVAKRPRGDDALRELLGRYVDLILENRDLVAVYAAELQNLPPARYRLLQRRRLERARRWTSLLRTCRAQLPQRLARVSVLATLEMLFAVARSHRYDEALGLHARAENLAWAALQVQ